MKFENWLCDFEFEDVAWWESLYEVKCRAIQAAHADKLHSNHLMSSSPSKLQKHFQNVAWADKTSKNVSLSHDAPPLPRRRRLRAFSSSRGKRTRRYR